MTTTMTISFPYVCDFSPGGVTPTAIDDAVRMLHDQQLAPTAENWVSVCEHFLSQSCITPARKEAYTRLRDGIRAGALSRVVVEMPSMVQRGRCPVCSERDCETRSEHAAIAAEAARAAEVRRTALSWLTNIGASELAALGKADNTPPGLSFDDIAKERRRRRGARR